MAETIGKVQEVNGNFQIVDENGNAVQLQEGLEVKIGDQIQGVVEVVNGQIQLVDESGNILELIDGQTLNTLDETTVNANQNTTIELNNGQEVIVNNQNNLLLDQTVTNNAPVDFQDTVIDNDTLDSLENDLVNEENLVVENDNDNNENNEEEQIQSDSSKARELDRNADVANVIADLREPVLNFREEDENIFGDDILFTQATLSISGASIVYEGNETIYTLSLTETASTDMLVTLSYSGVAIDGTDYTSIKEVTIPAGEKETTFIIETIDDYISDNNEPYTIVIIDAVGGGFDNLFIDSQADRVTTTIKDDSQPNTPNNPNDPVEPELDSVTVKLVALDENGNEVAANEVKEGNSASYKVVLEDENGNRITTATGTVEVTFSGNSATDNVDYNATTQTVNINTAFSTNTIDDYIADSGETFNVQITDDTYSNASAYENVVHDITAVTTTITDDSQPNTPNNPNDPVEPELDSVTVKLVALDENGNEVAANEVKEGNPASYKVVLEDENGNRITTATGTVEVTFSGNSATDNVDYNATTQTVNINTAFSTNTIDDYISDNNETYNVKITDDTYSNASAYENVVHDTTAVTTTIKDDTGTPNTPNDGEEPNHESVILKLVALDVNGDPILDGSGNYTFANEVKEGNDAKYMVLAFAPDETTFSPSTKLSNQVGNVDVTFGNGTATGANTQSKNDGSEDFNNSAQSNVTLGTVISTSTYDDYLSDNNETFTISITDNTYAPTSGGYENVDIDTTAVTTTIKDDTGTPNTPNDGEEPNHESVILKLVALDVNGDPILDGSGNYTFANEVKEGNDAKYMVLAFAPDETTFSPSTKLSNQVGNVDVTFGNGTATGANTQSKNDGSEDFNNSAQSNVTLGTVISTSTYDDYLSDNNETFTISITDNTYAPTSGGYENVDIDTTAVTTTIKDDTGTPNTPNDGEEPNHESVILKLVALDVNGDPILDGSGNYTFANEVKEGNDAKYMVLAFAPDETTFSPSTKLSNQVGNVDVTFGNGTATGANTQSKNDGSEDFNNSAQSNVTLGTVISTSTYDDYLSDNNETFTISITDNTYAPTSGGYENVDIDTTAVTTTIKDDTGTPNTPNDGEEPNHESVILKLVALDVNGDPILDGSGNYTFANEVKEGNDAKYMVLAFAPDETTFSPSTKLSNQVGNVDVTFANGTATGANTQSKNDGSEDFNNSAQSNVTLGTVISTSTYDDYLSDNNETFTISITDNTYAPTSGGYENVDIDTTAVTTTIKDDTGTPNTPNDGEEPNHESVILKLVALDVNGDPILDGSGNYTFANEVKEGNDAKYMVLAFAPDETTFSPSTKLSNQVGNVDVTFGNGTATGANTQSKNDGSEDFNNSAQSNVTLGTVISTSTYDDYLSDNNETFTISITDNTYAPTTGGYENVDIDTTAVTTTIKDDTGTPNTPNDGEEPNHESVILKLVALDVNGDPILDGSGNYTFANEVKEGNDAKYMVLAFAPDETTFSPSTKLSNQVGNVDVTFGNGTATGANTQSKNDGSEDFNNSAQSNVTLGTVISTSTYDDYLSDNNETFTISITDNTYAPTSGGYENVDIDTTAVTTTIKDDTGTPNTPNDGEEPNHESVILKLVALDVNGDPILDGSGNYTFANEVKEGNDAKYMVLAFAPDETTFSPSTKLSNQVGNVDVTFANGTATGANTQSTNDGSEDFNNSAQSNVTLGTVISTSTYDDYLSDNNETFTISITDNTYAPTTGGYENVDIDTTAVTTTIKDDTGTPNTPNDGEEPNHESVILKLVALDVNGDPILDGSGNYTFANEVKEGNDAKYMVLAFAPDETTFSPSTKLSNQVGNVDVTFANGTANGANTQSTNDGSEDFNNSAQSNVTLGTVISTSTYDDYLSDNNETFTISITDNTYAPTTGGYENVDIDTTAVTTTIKDGSNDNVPNEDIDTIYVQLSGDDFVEEANGATLTHNLKLVDKDGAPVSLASGETITLTLAYENDGTLNADFTSKKTTITITGNGTSDYTFSNIVTDDILKEGTETYDIKISSIDSHSNYFENVQIAYTANGANTTVNGAKGTINEEIELNNENETVVEGAAAITNVTESMNLLDNDELGVNGKITSFTYTDESDNLQTATLTGASGSKTATVDSKYGTITINEDGTWSFTPDATENNASGVNDVFTYTVTDDNAATGTANFTVNVTDTNPSATAPNSIVDEDDLSTGSDITKDSLVVTKTLNITKDQDDISDVTFDSSTVSALNALSLESNNVSIKYYLSNNGHTLTASTSTTEGGIAANNTIFTIDLQNTNDTSGTTQAYTFELKGAIDHPNGSSQNSIDLPFNFKVSDIDSTVSGTAFNITVVDDIPEAKTEAKLSVVEGNVALVGMINLLSNDVEGADQPISTITSFTYKNESGNTVAGTLGQNMNTEYGTLRVNSDGTWTYTSDGTENNPGGTDAVTDSFTYVITDVDGDTSSATQEIDVTDGANPTIAPLDKTIDETNLGSAASLSSTKVSETLGVTKGSDNIADTKFTTSVSDLNALALKSGGVALTYTVTDYKITAYKGSDKAFEITLKDTSSTSASYEFELFLPLDHFDDGVNDKNDVNNKLEIPFAVYTYDIDDNGVIDGDDDASGNFKVTVHDSIPTVTPNNITMNEDGTPVTIRISQDNFKGDIKITANDGVQQTVSVNSDANIYDTEGNDIIGTLKNNGDGTVTFTPVADYSNYNDNPTFDYVIEDFDGDEKSATVTITVNPIADAPTDEADKIINTVEDSNITTATTDVNSGNQAEGTNSTPLSLILPVRQDQTDKNDITGSNTGDNPERLGVITFDFTNSSSAMGTVTIKYDTDGNGSLDGTLTTVSDNDSFTIDITDVANYHPTGTSGDYHLTEAQYNSLAIIHEEDNDKDIKFTVSVYSHEVDDSGALLSPDVKSSKTTQNVELDITAVTDDISLVWDSNTLGTMSTVDNTGSGGNNNTNNTYTFNTVSEGSSAIDLKSILTKTSGYENDASGDLDGSEQRTYTIEGVPEGTVITLNGQSATANSSGIASISFNTTNEKLEDPDFSMTLPPQYGGNISGAKITLSVADKDSDTGANGATKSAEVYFNINVTPVADDVTVAIKQSFGNEDAGRKADGTTDVSSAASGIDLDVTITTDDKDGSETYTIVLSEIPDGAEIYYDGNLITNTSGSVNANITATNDIDTEWSLQIKEFDNSKDFKIVPPYNSNEDINLKVAANAVDGADTGAQVTNLDLNVKVTGVADTMTHNGLNSVTIDDTNNVTKTYNKIVKEDTSQVTLETLFTANTPGFTSADISGSDGSETGFVIITDVPSGFDISGAQALGGSGTSREWLVEISDFSNVKLDIPANYSGEVDLTLKLQSIENDGDKSSFTNVPLKILITPETDGIVNGSATQNEDEIATLTFNFNNNSDLNESLDLLEIDTNSLSLAGVQLFKNGIDITSTGWVSIDINSDTITAKTPADLDTDYSFDYRYKNSDTTNDSSDFTDYTQNDNTYDDESSNANYVSGTYNVTVNAVTDTATLVLNTIIDADLDANSDISYDSGSKTVTVTDNTIFEVPFTLTSDDMNSEGSNGKDIDGSEKILATVELSGVPEGIDVVGGVYLGDKFDNSGNVVNSGRWRVDITNDLVMNSSSGENNSIKFAVAKDSYTDINAAITFTISHQDTGASVLTNSETFNLIIDSNNFAGTQPDPSTPPVDLNVTLNSTNFVEDEAKTLNNFFNVSDADSNPANNTGKYVITITNLEGGTVSGMELIDSEFYSLSGTGDINDIITSLTSISITPNSNENINTPSNVKFDVAITTYGLDEHNTYSFDDVTSVVAPVTDQTTIDISGNTTIDEDSSETFTISLSNSADGNRTTIIDGKVYLKLSDTASTDGGTNGSFSLVGGTLPSVTTIGINSVTDEQGNSLPAGDYYVLIGVSLSDTIQVKYTPPANEYGNNVSIDVYTITKEDPLSSGYNTQTLLTNNSINATVNSVNDGITPFTPTAVGNEDEIVLLDFSGASLSDSSESIVSATLSGVPFGYEVYLNNVKQTGTVIGKDSNGDYLYEYTFAVSSIADLETIGVKKIGIEDFSGKIENLTLKVKSGESGVESNQTLNNFEVQFNPVADQLLSMTVTKTFGDEYAWTAVNINANVKDTDGSETLQVQLTASSGSEALDETAIFRYSDGTLITTATFNSGTWTISDIAYDKINDIEIMYHEYNDNVDVVVKTVDTNNGITNTLSDVNDSEGTFKLKIDASTSITTGAEDNTIIYGSGKSIDAGAGTDTLILDSGINLDFDNVLNVSNFEKIDLSKNGNHSLSDLDINDIINFTDSNNIMQILGDSGDSVNFKNSHKDWDSAGTQNIDGQTYDVYTKDSGGNTVTLKIDEDIITNII